MENFLWYNGINLEFGEDSMLINVRYGEPKKLASPQSIYVSFNYKQSIVDTIRLIPDRYWDGKNKIWELSYDSLSFLKEKLPNDKFNVVGEPINEKKFGEKLIEHTYEVPKELKTKMFQYQIDGYNELMNFDKYLLLDSQGLGKSITTIAVALKRKEINGIKHCLIVCGVNGLKYNWQNEIKQHTGMDSMILGNRQNRKGVWSTGSNADKLEDLNNLRDFFIITNVESLRDKNIKDKLKMLFDKGIIDMCILDELHKAKSPSSQQGKALLLLANHIKYFYGLTGTVIKNNPLDIYVPLKCVGKELANFTQFKSRYCVYGGFGGYQVLSYKHLDELQNKLDTVSLRRTKEEVLDLPPKIYMDDYVEMGTKQKKIYSDVLKAVLEDIDNISLSLDPLSQLIRLRQATADTSILSSTVNESAKITRLIDIIEECISNNQKVVVFSSWTKVTDIVYNKLKEYNPALITGNVKDREKEKNKFMKDSSCKVIVGTIGAMGTGYTLTEASTVVFLDEPYTWADKEQASDRIYRIGTKSSVNIITLLCKDTIDEYIHRLVNKKKVLGDAVVDKRYNLKDKEVLNYILTGEGNLYE